MKPAPGGPNGPNGPGRAASRFIAHHHHPLLRVVIAMVVITALAALVAYLVVRFTNRRGGHAPMTATPVPTMAMAGPAPSVADAALEQLRMRYARGDVSRADYLQAAADLGAPVPEAPPPTAPV